tara:strand:- start:9180 stop:9611 length:432 start_codon:yes stop_codon:yes gene_type:complete
MTLDQNLTLFENSKNILAELKNTNIALRQMVIYQQQTTEQLRYINELLDGFTNGGASLNGYIPDAFVQAYVSVVSPVLAKRLGDESVDLEELMKGATLLARRLLEELSAYRSEQEAKDILSEVMAHVDDPWDRPDNSPSELDP